MATNDHSRLNDARVSRFHKVESTTPPVVRSALADQRTPFERDRDRIHYSSAFHRLAGITQIVRAGELDIFHTRQQHTFKVAQIGRRLAQHRIREQSDIAEVHGLDQEVVEAACLAHDIGHPPFGHAAEKELDRIVRDPKVCGGKPQDAAEDGYEGNAQTFRILTKLAVRFQTDRPGLDLTRATLAATLKYPWHRDLADPQKKKREKWSAYTSEAEEFAWAREHCKGEFKTAEAELMDWADDIAYSVHDLEDFHRVGIIPWHEIVAEDHRDRIIKGSIEPWKKDPDFPGDAQDRMEQARARILERLELFPKIKNEAYNGERDQRRQLRNFTSDLIGGYIRAVTLNDSSEGRTVSIDPKAEDEVRLLKYFARYYVIGLPALHAQQHGQKRIIRELFSIFLIEGKAGNLKLFPNRLRYIWDDNPDDKPARLAADCVASLTENEAHQLHHRLMGTDGGLVLDPIVR